MISTRGQNTNDIGSNTTLEVEDVNYVLKKIKHLVLHFFYMYMKILGIFQCIFFEKKLHIFEKNYIFLRKIA